MTHPSLPAPDDRPDGMGAIVWLVGLAVVALLTLITFTIGVQVGIARGRELAPAATVRP